VSRATDPSDPQRYVKELAREVVKLLDKDGLIRKGPR